MDLTKDEQKKLVMGKGAWHTNEIEGKVPSIMMTDGPHGLRKETNNGSMLNNSVPATCFPTESALSSSWNPDLAKEMGGALAEEAKANGVNIVLGCGVNIKRSPLCGRNFEYFSEDPYLSGTLATNYINGVQEKGIGTSIKHFAGNNQESNRMTSNSMIDERALREIYLPSFEMAVKNAQPTTIMASYNYLNGTHSTENKELLTNILRKEWGFKGLVVSDWGACLSPEKAIPAGMDLEMAENGNHKNADIPDDALSVAAERVANLANTLSKNISKIGNSPKELLDKNHALAVKMECESAVLLKNDGTLPLTDKSQKIIIVGDLAEHMRFQGGGSSRINATHTPNAVDAFMQAGYIVTYLPGYNSLDDKQDLKLEREALIKIDSLTAHNPEVPILFFGGLTDNFEGEGYDRTTLEIPKNQIALLDKIYEINKNIIWINISGSAVEMPFIDKVHAILHMYLGGQGVDEAVVKLVSGDVNPSGKLSETFPLKLSDTPCYDYFATGYDIQYRESIFVGYRYYTTYNRPVLFPFGHGLSYTSFQYYGANITQEGIQTTSIDGLSSQKPEVTFKLKNIGLLYGKEVAQIYVKNPKGDFLRPELELVGFKKVALYANEEQIVKIELSDRTFKIWDENSHAFVTIPGEYELFIGSSIEDIRLALRFYVTGHEYERADREKLSEYFNQSGNGFNISEEQFKKLYGKELSHFNNLKPGEYSKYNSLEQLSKRSWLARVFMKTAIKIMSKSFKGKSKDDPNVKMVLNMIREAPLDTIMSWAIGKLDYKFADKLIKSANR